MNRMACKLGLIVLLLIGVNAYAIPIEYEVSGTVTTLTERGMVAPSAFTTGSAFTGTIWYDADLAVPRPVGGPTTYAFALAYEFHFADFTFTSAPVGSSRPWITFHEEGFFAFDEVPRDNLYEISPAMYAQELWFDSRPADFVSGFPLPASLPFSDLNLLHIWIWDEGIDGGDFSFDAPFIAKEVPEPGTLGLFGLALIVIAIALHRRRG
jgi:hypothetical protein